MSYTAIIGEIKVSKHPNADKLQLGQVLGKQVIVGLDTNDTLGIYFECDGQLSKVFAESNNLLRVKDPITGEYSGGYFEQNRRVKALKLRGEVSDGFWCPLNYLNKIPELSSFDVATLKVGDQFTEINGIPICNKYETPATKKRKSTQKQNTRKQEYNRVFPQHFDTKQFQYELSSIPVNSILYFTEKLHGTSARYGLSEVEVTLPNPWYRKLLRLEPKKAKQWQYLMGSRKVVLGNFDPINEKWDEYNCGYYGDNEFRKEVFQTTFSNLYKGEMIYGEIVGYSKVGSPLFSHDTTKMDKKFVKQFGKKMVYNYDCVDGKCDFYVYRITHVNPDGVVTDLPWARVKKRCELLGLKTVPELVQTPMVYTGDSNKLQQVVKNLVDGYSTLCSTHIREGVCIRVEQERGVTVLKEKSWTFKFLEGIIKESKDYVDIEEIS